LRSSLRGRTQVEDYLAILRATYQVQEAMPPTLVEIEGKVIVMGSERAWLVRNAQSVKADWTAIFELHEGRIHSVSMIVYRWTILDSQACKPTPVPARRSAAKVSLAEHSWVE
jgi:hypothetical protein